ncbi:MAG: NAD(P)/FAD-dependent oxidoreductase [Pseudobutyrivibrio sp.]|nr:NAD(P)/FAD-dependent oxidoreductase [Pseudobutyrivibrio sp.]
MYENLFSSKKIGNMTVANRTVMTAMGNYLADEGGYVSDKDVAFYGARAKGGTGLVITECTAVDSKSGLGNDREIVVDDDKYIPGLKRMADEVHKYGSKLCVQIYHPGRQGIAVVNGVESMKSASQTECQIVHQPTHEMTKAEIDEMVDKFAQAARRIKEAGVDAVEIHGAHGYLIGQFSSPYTNKRTDEYGGSFENRMRFFDEIIAAVRKEVGPDFPIIARYSVDEHMEYVGQPDEGLHLADGVEIGKHLEAQGVDALDVSSGIYETMNTAWEPVGFDQGWKAEGPAAVKAAVNIPVIGVAVIRDPEYAEELLSTGKLDFVGSARAFFADPEWANKAKDGRACDIRKCISCLYCMESLMSANQERPMGCSVNFEAGRENMYQAENLTKNGEGRTVAIIGAGPAGLEAARILAIRGFKPVVFEKQDHLGGQVYLASKPPKKEKTGWLIDFEETQLKKYGVEIRLNTAADVETVRALNPYAVLVATGSSPIMPKSIKGLDGANVHTPVEILDGSVKLSGKNICVVGSGMTGIETAELLLEQGNKVSVFEMADDIGPGLFFQNLMDVMSRVGAHDAALCPKHKLVEIDGNKVTFETTDTNEVKTFEFDEFVVSLGVASNKAANEEFEKAFENVVFLGDALKTGRIEAAIRTGYMAAAEL